MIDIVALTGSGIFRSARGDVIDIVALTGSGLLVILHVILILFNRNFHYDI